MQGIIEEGKKLMQEDASEDVMDAGLIAAAQKAEHYEIAAYGSVKAWADLLGQDEISSLLDETLEEEESTDRRLSEIAEAMVNAEAAMGSSQKESGEDFEESEDGDIGEDREHEEAPARKRSTATRTRTSRRRK